MEQSMSNYGFLNQLANNELASYRAHLESIDQQNSINKIVGITGIIGNLQAIPSLLSKSLTGVRTLNNSLRVLPQEETTYFKSLKNNPQEVSRTGLNEDNELTLPENRIADFSRKYYSDDEFRSNVENELNNGEGDLTRVAEENGIRGISAEEARLGYNYGSAYRDFGNNLRVRNPEMTVEDIDQNVSRYANRIENSLQENMKFIRDPSIADKPNVIEQAINRIGSRATGEQPNSAYEFLDDAREQIRGDVISNSNKTFETLASSGNTRSAGTSGNMDNLELDDFASAEVIPESNVVTAEPAVGKLVDIAQPTEEVSVSARMGEAVSQRLQQDIQTGAGSAERPFSITETNPELFQPTAGKTAFPLLEEPAVTPKPSIPEPTTSASAEPAVEMPEVATATETSASTATESTIGGLASEIGGQEATGLLELGASVLNPIMLLGSAALLGFQTFQLFNKQAEPPKPAITYGQINEGE